MPRSISHSPGHDKAAWAVAILLALVFIPAGLAKVAGPQVVQEQFQAWGYTAWFMYLIGILEIAAGVLVLVPRVATYAAGYLGVQMLGAIVTHVVNAEALMALVPIAVGALALYEMWARIPDAAGTEPQPEPYGT